jgi:hypothetical protein
MGVRYDAEEMEEDLVDRREDAIEGVTVETPPLREAWNVVESDLNAVFATPLVVDDDGVPKTSYIWSRRCEDTTSKPDWTAAVERERLVGAAAAMVFAVDMVKEVKNRGSKSGGRLVLLKEQSLS